MGMHAFVISSITIILVLVYIDGKSLIVYARKYKRKYYMHGFKKNRLVKITNVSVAAHEVCTFILILIAQYGLKYALYIYADHLI